MQEEPPKYLAFISYSRADNAEAGRQWADWLKAMIESFPIPVNCEPAVAAGQARHSREVFLDRLRMTAGGELQPKLDQHLQVSQFLVLICSPRSAASQYVAFEIEHFKNAGKWHKIIPVVIDGMNPTPDPRECWLPECLRDTGPALGDDGNTITGQGHSLVYADFRPKEKWRDNDNADIGGWTDPASYEQRLRQANKFSKSETAKRVAAYRRDHSVAKYALLGELFGLEPQQLSGESLLEDNERKRRAIQATRRRVAVTAAVALVMAGMAGFAYRSYRIAERERIKSERSLLLIGDAHEDASRMVADVLVDLRAKLEPGGQAGALTDAQRIVNEHFDENEMPGDDADSLHMRSVVLNSRGYLARSLGDFTAAGTFYTTSLEIRDKLLGKDRNKAMYQHNLAVSYDNLGDLNAAKALSLRAAGQNQDKAFDAAIEYYRKGLELAKRLESRPDATPQWRHDLAVSYFKVGDALFEAGYPDDALGELLAGMPLAERVAASDPSYAKWQAHLGLYCLEVGRLQALASKSDEARALLQKGKKIFSGLRDQGHLSRQYAAWLQRIEAILLDLG
ncbi:MAG: toll/interleukin-1 receptor domain-containing protein [Verrucomicrobiota bacterium]